MSVLERAEALGRKAVALDPDCQPARFTMALIYFLNFQRTLFLAESAEYLRLNPHNAFYIAAISHCLAMVGEWERATKLTDKAMRLNPHHPGWYHMVAFMNHYRQGEYDLAWVEAQRFNTPDFFGTRSSGRSFWGSSTAVKKRERPSMTCFPWCRILNAADRV